MSSDPIRRSSALLRPLTLAALLLGLGMAQAQAPQPEEVIYPRTAKPVKAKPKPVARPAAVPPAAMASGAVSSSGTRCGEDETSQGNSAPQATAGVDGSSTDPRGQMQSLVQMAITRSASLGASTLLAQAARDDWEEARAARLPVVSLGGSFGGGASKQPGFGAYTSSQTNLSLSMGAALYDAGRSAQMANFRSQLAEVARQGLIGTEQQLALQTVSLALDRSRYLLQMQVYGQYVRKMACLVDSLEIVVQADKGRASELVQARKNQRQAEMSVDQTRSALKQTEIRLRRFVGDDLPPSASFAALLTAVPSVAEVQAGVASAADVVALEAQAKAQASLAEVVVAGTKPQVNWSVGGTGVVGQGQGQSKVGSVQAGVSVSIPLYNPSAPHSIAAARKRAQAALLQRDDAVEGRTYRVMDMHETAVSSFDRARTIVDILRSSETLRAATLLQWQQMGRRSLFDVLGTEADYYGLRISHINAIFDGQQAVALLWSLGSGVMTPLR